MKARWLAPVWLVAMAGTALAVDPVTLTHGRYEDLADGSGRGVALHGDGRLTLGPALEPLADTGAQRVWRLLAADDALWIATGDEGRLLRLRPGGEPEIVLDSPEVSIHALARAQADVYAGTSPDGLVYRVRPDGSVTTTQTGTGYVWDLVVDGKDVVVATGQPARVLRLRGGETSTLFEPPGDAHVRALVRAGGRWVAGTAAAGGDGDDERTARIYEIADGRGRLLVETAFQEVTHLVADGDTLFAAVTRSPDDGQPVAALLRIDPGGAAWPLWQGRGVPAGLLAPHQGRLTLALREPGRIFEIDSRGVDGARVADVDSVAPNALTRWRSEAVLGDGSSGRLVRLAARPDSGWFETPVRDLGRHGRWGALDLDAEGDVVVRTRSGNGATPDETWSAWEAPVKGMAASPPARYLQARLRLRGDAVVRRLSVTGRQTNLAPRIESLTTFAYRGNPQAPGPPPPSPSNGNGNQRNLPQSKSLRLVRWQASDPNDDALRYRLYLRGEGQQTWKLVEEEIEQTTVYWDTETMPEGMTRLRLVAHDGAGNADALTDERISEAFPIDHSPPTLELSTRRDDGTVVVEARIRDRVTAVRGASWHLDYADSGPRLAAADGLFDSSSESASLRLDGLAPGEHVISVQAWDELDNVGVARVVVTID